MRRRIAVNARHSNSEVVSFKLHSANEWVSSYKHRMSAAGASYQVLASEINREEFPKAKYLMEPVESLYSIYVAGSPVLGCVDFLLVAARRRPGQSSHLSLLIGAGDRRH